MQFSLLRHENSMYQYVKKCTMAPLFQCGGIYLCVELLVILDIKIQKRFY